MWRNLGTENEFKGKLLTRTKVGEKEIVIGNDGSFHAFSPQCCHRGAPLEDGHIESGCLICPWHRSVFNLAFGPVVSGPAKHALKKYPCRVHDGVLQVWMLEQSSTERLMRHRVSSAADLEPLRESEKDFIVELPRGLRLTIRAGAGARVGDLDILEEVFFGDCYGMRDFKMNSGAVLDIGAHVGIFALYAASVAPGARIFCFEPEEANYTALLQNLDLNPWANISAFPYAVSGKNEIVSFFTSDWNSGGHSMFFGQKKGNVQAYSLETIMKSLGITRVSLLKLDCEGAEYPILMSSSSALLRQVEAMVIEDHLFEAYESEWPRESLETKLRESGFGMTELMKVAYPGEGEFRTLLARLG